MSGEALAGLLRQALLVLGCLFAIVNLRLAWEIVAWWRRRARAVVVWPAPRPPFFGVNLAIGVVLGVLLVVTTVVVPRPAASVFGVAMMFGYYGYLLPLSTRIRRGLYDDGVWTDSGFMPYAAIGGVAWKGGEPATLVLASRRSVLARRLVVPGSHLGEVRHVLREKIGRHDILTEEGPGLHLGGRDGREGV